MALIQMEGVFGNDSQTPMYDPEPFWKEYSIKDIFRGQAGRNKIIPKVGDHIRDPDIFATYRVESIDSITYVPNLVRIYPEGMSLDFTAVDRLMGVGLGRSTDAYRLYVNNDVYPYVACVDAVCKVSGTLCKYARVFRVSETGELEVISKVFDSSGQFVTDKVNLELVQIQQVLNYSTKIVPPFKFTQTLKNNDSVVVYFYSDSGNIVSKQELLVEETSFVRSIDESLKYVSHISLRSPYLSLTNDSQLNIPLSIPATSLNIKGVVHYSNGESREYDIDGGKFRLEGLAQVLSSIEGQRRDLMALYRLDSNEGTFAGTGPDGRTVEARYTLVVSNENLSYSVKLFPVLRWDTDYTGYKIDWYLLNMDRNLIYNVTDKIQFLESTGPFMPFGYGYVQSKQVSLRLKDVSNTFQAFTHTQVVDFTMYGKPSATLGTAWTIKNESNVNIPTFGGDVIAYKKSATTADISLGLDTVEEWLDAVYYNVSPLVDSRIELKAPRPTHFKITLNGVTSEYSINDWNTVIELGQNVAANNTLTFTFIKRTPSTDLYLAVSGMSVKDVI